MLHIDIIKYKMKNYFLKKIQNHSGATRPGLLIGAIWINIIMQTKT